MKKEATAFRGWTRCDHCRKKTNKVFLIGDDGSIENRHNSCTAGRMQLCSKCNKELNK